MTVSRRDLRAVALCLLCVAAISWAGVATATSPQTGISAPRDATVGTTHVQDCAETAPSDHADPAGGTAEVIGWVDGLWYNESLGLTEGDTHHESDLRPLAASTAARLEARTSLAIEEIPPITFQTHAEYQTELEVSAEDIPDGERAFMNGQYAMMLVAGQDEDAVDVLIETRASTPAALYSAEASIITIMTDDSANVTVDDVDEVTLAHELVHALQDQHFNISPIFEEETTDELRSSMAVVEGEASLVEEQYAENCGTWVDECLVANLTTSPPASWGLTLEQLAMYSTPLVATTYQQEGWSGVSALHEDLPDSMIEAIDPSQYGSFERAPLEVDDQSSDAWVDVGWNDTTGQHALTAMLIAPAVETNGQTAVVPVEPFLSEHAGGPYDYDHPATSGWQNDRLRVYERDDGALGSVWEHIWIDADEAERFQEAYVDLIEARGGERSEEFSNVYTFENVDAYDMAVGVEQAGDRVTIVTAPTVEELTAVHGGFTSVERVPPALTITDVSPTDAVVEPGESIEFTVTIENPGDGEVTETISAGLAGDTLVEKSVWLRSGDAQTVTLAFEVPAAVDESSSLEIRTPNDTQTVTLTLDEPTDTSAPDDGDETGDTEPSADTADDDDLPGMGPIVAAIAVLAAARIAAVTRHR